MSVRKSLPKFLPAKIFLPKFLPGWHEFWQSCFDVSFIFLKCEMSICLHSSLHCKNKFNCTCYTFHFHFLYAKRLRYAFCMQFCITLITTIEVSEFFFLSKFSTGKICYLIFFVNFLVMKKLFLKDLP